MSQNKRMIPEESCGIIHILSQLFKSIQLLESAPLLNFGRRGIRDMWARNRWDRYIHVATRGSRNTTKKDLDENIRSLIEGLMGSLLYRMGGIYDEVCGTCWNDCGL